MNSERARVPRRPSLESKWHRLPDFVDPDGHRAERWRRKSVLVLSSFFIAPFRGRMRPQWHVSVSASGQRPNQEQLTMALRWFGMEFAEEDNHSSGVARHFFLIADLAPGEAPGECECKEDEEIVVEPDGYTWSRRVPTASAP